MGSLSPRQQPQGGLVQVHIRVLDQRQELNPSADRSLDGHGMSSCLEAQKPQPPAPTGAFLWALQLPALLALERDSVATLIIGLKQTRRSATAAAAFGGKAAAPLAKSRGSQ